MYDVRLFRPPNKETATLVIVAVVLLVVVFFAGYLLGLRHVSDHGGGADTVGNQLAETGTAIQHAKDGIDTAAGTADKVGAGIGAAKESAGYLQHTADTSAELIADCQRIIRQVRARGKEKAPQNQGAAKHIFYFNGCGNDCCRLP